MQSKTIGIVVIVLVVIVGGYFLLRRSYQAPSPTPDEIPAKEISQPIKTQPTVLDEETSKQQLAGGVKEFNMTAQKWQFNPGTITVNKGDTVKLHVESVDVAHGFELSAFGVNERLEPGKTVDVEFVASKTGTFTFACTVSSCGSGHSGMKGQLVVK